MSDSLYTPLAWQTMSRRICMEPPPDLRLVAYDLRALDEAISERAAARRALHLAENRHAASEIANRQIALNRAEAQFSRLADMRLEG